MFNIAGQTLQQGRPIDTRRDIITARDHNCANHASSSGHTSRTHGRQGGDDSIGGQPRYIRKFTRPQMEEHKRLSLCYNCEEKYTSNHACKQLFYIELVNDTPTTATEIATPDLEISLHTLTGISTDQTM